MDRISRSAWIRSCARESAGLPPIEVWATTPEAGERAGNIYLARPAGAEPHTTRSTAGAAHAVHTAAGDAKAKAGSK